MQDLISRFGYQPPSPTLESRPSPPIIMQEWNQEASTLLTALAAKFMGMPPESLMNNPGLRALVGQQLGWLHPAPDCIKLTGLLVTKKWNQMLLPHNASVENLLAINATDHSDDGNMSGMVLDHSSAPPVTVHSSIVPEADAAAPVHPSNEEEGSHETTTSTYR
jgi:hypothetical protein